MPSRRQVTLGIAATAAQVAASRLARAGEAPRTAEGYSGIWYQNQPSGDRYGYKYSGGFATYPQQQSPIAIHVPSQKKTFFCYGGTVEGKEELLHMVSYFDHATGMVPRPTLLLNKHTEDAHDNPVMSIDEGGFIWIFSNAHGTSRPSFIHRSRNPYDIRDFELIVTTNFSYGHPWWHRGKGFLMLQTLYEEKGRSLYFNTSADGRQWSKPQLLARAELGHYQITAHQGDRTASVFNVHPQPVGLNARTNLYYVETRNMGRTWKTAGGKTLEIPLRSAVNDALVHDYKKEGRLVYLKEVAFGNDGHPVILYLTSAGYESGPKSDPRIWHTARWTGAAWEIREFTRSDHNYDFGALWIEADGTWRVIAPTEPGPEPYTTGGDMVMWTSRNQGKSWKKIRRLTVAKHFNHTYARKPVDAHPDFYALWADGDTLKPSVSHLYFTDKNGSAVWRLPARMTRDFEKPERLATAG
ncbi:MAG: BNR-4 repeat-containing protein [Bryobacterales bacterium]|nr:BNR-4 repeat-containing protein [Bryobacterales bacterium]